MANIDYELSVIKGDAKTGLGGRGEDVRQAIVDAIKKIYNDREYQPTTKKFTHNTGPEGETGGPWDKVIVQVEGGTDIDNIDDASGHPITDNGYYTIKDLINLGIVDNPNCIGIDGLTVAVGQTTGQFGEINITENGVYDPLLDGYDGYSKVYVNVLGGERKDFYPVRFYDGNRLIETNTQVPYGGNAVCTKLDKLSGSVFTGWNPNPINVNRDMNCYAVYSSPGSSAYGDYTETIYDSWSQIITKVKSGTRAYEPGTTKFLILKGFGGAQYILNMMLMGYNMDENENGGNAYTTWINVNPNICVFEDNAGPSTDQNYIFGKYSTAPQSPTQCLSECGGTTIWWGNSLARAIFNADPSDIVFKTAGSNNDLTYFNNLSNLGLLLPTVIDKAAGTELFRNIVKVKKYSYQRTFPVDSATPYDLKNKLTLDKIWIPSTRELCYPLHNGSPNIPTQMCTLGNSYGNPNFLTYSIYVNNHSNMAFLTRDNSNFAKTGGQGKVVNASYMVTTDAGNAGKGFIASYTANFYGSNFNIGFCL